MSSPDAGSVQPRGASAAPRPRGRATRVRLGITAVAPRPYQPPATRCLALPLSL